MKEYEVWYEPHPVSKERKQELLAKGYRIIDARFKPPLLPDFAPSGNTELSVGDVKKLDVASLRAELTKRGIEFDEKAKKADLVELLEGALGAGND